MHAAHGTAIVLTKNFVYIEWKVQTLFLCSMKMKISAIYMLHFCYSNASERYILLQNLRRIFDN